MRGGIRLLWRRGLRAACLFLCAAVLLSSLPARSEAEDVERYAYGRLNGMFVHGDGTVEALRVLYDRGSGVLFIDPASLQGRLEDYDCQGQAEACTVAAAGREYDFSAGSADATMRLGDARLNCTMSAPAISRDGRFWVPVNDFLYLTNIRAVPLASDDDESEWDPVRDVAVFLDPTWTIPDLLKAIFDQENGGRWLFTYQDDFGLSPENVLGMFNSAVIGHGAYSLLISDKAVIYQLCSENVTTILNGLSNAWSAVTKSEARVFASAYEKAYYRKFIEAMASPASAQKDAVAGDIQDACSFVGQLGEYTNNIIGATAKSMKREEILAKKSRYLTSKFYKPPKYVSVKQMESLSKKVDAGNDVLSDVLGLLQFGVAAGNAVDKLASMDELTLEAIGLFLEASKDNRQMDDVSRVSLEKSFEDISEDLKGLTKELVAKAFEIFGGKLIELFDEGLGNGLELFGEAFREGWSILEDNFPNLIPSQEILDLFQMSLYVIYYETDALRVLSERYHDHVLPGGFSDPKQLREAGLLALNYLKACLVTTECGLKVYENNDEVRNSQGYAGIRAKAARMATMIDRLSVALASLKSGDAYAGLGVGFDSSSAALAAPDPALLPLVLFKSRVAFSYDPFTAHAGTVTMYLLEGDQILGEAVDGSTDGIAVRLTDDETGFRPAPVSGGVSTRVKVLSLPDGCLLAEWDAAASAGSTPSVQSVYTIYEPRSGYGFRTVLTGTCRVSGAGDKARIAACTLDGAECGAEPLEASFAEHGVEFQVAAIAVGTGGKPSGTLSYFTAASQDGAALLDLSSDAVTTLPPLIEELLDQYGLMG